MGILKVKVLAVLLGPAGVGLMGLYQNIMGMASTLAGCGMGTSGVRQLAVSSGEAHTLALVRRTLWLANLSLGLVGMAALWMLREPVARWVFGETEHMGEVGWLGVGTLLTLIASSQTALLQGLRRIGDLARVNAISSSAGALVGIMLVYWLGEAGVVWFVLAAPAISVVVAAYFAARLPRPRTVHDWEAISQQCQGMLKLGIPFMAAALLTLVTQLAARSIILRELGLDASGYFQAAWAISMTYIGFVLSAMGTDYFPRLTGAISDHSQARKLVNEQTEMALLLASPVLLAMITLAPWVVHLLYAPGFAPASEVLRWQILGDILKIASWPLGFILVATGRSKIYIGTQLSWSAVYLTTIFLGIQHWGLVAAGLGFWFAYLVIFFLNTLIATVLIGQRPGRRNWVFIAFLSLAGSLIIYLSAQSASLGYSAGLLATLVTSVYSLRRLDGLVDLRGWLKRRFGVKA